jgi:hypothetical protein
MGCVSLKKKMKSKRNNYIEQAFQLKGGLVNVDFIELLLTEREFASKSHFHNYTPTPTITSPPHKHQLIYVHKQTYDLGSFFDN